MPLGEQRPGRRKFALLVADPDQVQALNTIYGANILLKKRRKTRRKKNEKENKKKNKSLTKYKGWVQFMAPVT